MTNADASAESRARGAQLLAETIAAHGGDAFLNEETLTLTGHGEFTTPPQLGAMTLPISAFTFYVARGARSRLEARSLGGRILVVNRGWGRGGFALIAGRTLELPAAQTDGTEPMDVLRRAVSEGYPVFAVNADPPEIADDDTPLVCFDVEWAPGRVARFSVESESKRVRRMFVLTARGEMTVLLSGYGSLPFPEVFSHIQLLENGANVFKLSAAGVTRDEPLKDALFEQP